jgi:hypothetical protein
MTHGILTSEYSENVGQDPMRETLTEQGLIDRCTHNHSPSFLMLSHKSSDVSELIGWEDSPLVADKGRSRIEQSFSSHKLEMKKDDYVYISAESIDRQEFFMSYCGAVEDGTKKRRFTMLGFINNVAYHAGRSCGAISKDDKAQWTIDREALLELESKDFSLMTALSHTQDYLIQYWPEASCNINYIRDCIDELAEYGFLAYHSEQGKGKRSRIYTFLDLPKLLLFAEMLEQSLGFDELPEHKGGIIQRLFNAFFSGWGYNRKGDPDTVPPTTYEESVQARAETSLSWREWIQDSYRSALNGYKSVIKAFGPHDPLTLDVFEEVKRIAQKGRINQRKNG